MTRKLTAVDGLGILILGLEEDDARLANHQGQCDDDAAMVAALPYVKAQLDAAGPEKIRAALREVSDWDLSDDELNRTRAVWVAAGNIQEQLRECAKS